MTNQKPDQASSVLERPQVPESTVISAESLGDAVQTLVDASVTTCG
jgi:hypothetical protein